jgi:hypothetical protein
VDSNAHGPARNGGGKHEVALWAAGAAFFGDLIGLKIIGTVTPVKVVGAIAIAVCVAGAVYCKQRLDDAKRNRDS